MGGGGGGSMTKRFQSGVWSLWRKRGSSVPLRIYVSWVKGVYGCKGRWVGGEVD